jgi:hypothetical protein
MFHHNWVKATGRVLDSRIRTLYNPDHNEVVYPITLHNYIIEVRKPDGETTRLEVEQHIETIDVGIGSEVPLLISPDGEKAIFDNKDPKINVMAVQKASQEADKERFRRQL